MASLQAFPAITEKEFSEACKVLEQRSADNISDTDWLSVRWTGEELLIRQRRNAGRKEDSDHEEGAKNEELIEDIVESMITDTLAPNDEGLSSLVVDFSITLSPTYSVPVLWFSCRYQPENKPLSLDQVYQCLVPQTSLGLLREVGVMGGISMAHHPVSDVPAFFMHPCNTQDALSTLKPDQPLTPEEYLILWLGLIGSAVGLHVPSKLWSAQS